MHFMALKTYCGYDTPAEWQRYGFMIASLAVRMIPVHLLNFMREVHRTFYPHLHYIAN